MFSGSAKVVAFVPLDSRHPSRPAFGVDAWGAENDGGRGSIARLVPNGSLPTRQDQRRRESSKKEYGFQPVMVRLVPGGRRNLFSPVNPC